MNGERTIVPNSISILNVGKSKTNLNAIKSIKDFTSLCGVNTRNCYITISDVFFFFQICLFLCYGINDAKIPFLNDND